MNSWPALVKECFGGTVEIFRAETERGRRRIFANSYRADLAISDEEARPVYRAMARALEPSVDLFLCETMSCIRESRNAVMAAREASEERGLPVFVSWTLDEEPGAGLRSGERIEDAFEALCDLEPDGFLFNCTHPAAIERGLEILSDLTDRPRGGYPNRFDVPEGWTLDNDVSVEVREGFGPTAFVEAAHRCVARGATLFGGCCGTGPEDIAALSAAFGSDAVRA